MARKVAVNVLNASTIDILNTIRANASLEYQNLVPVITKADEVPHVGEIIMGYPAMANQFIGALVNRIALVRVKSANFNNMYKDLKKGYLEFGETVEDVFVSIANAVDFSVEKAEGREFKRTLPDVKSSFYTMNWRVQYPITIQDEDLRTAFLSMEGVQDLISRIVDAVYTANEYDEYLLFKYLIIKAIANGKMYPVEVGTTLSDSAVSFRSLSNKMTFMSNAYNESGVRTITPKSRQQIFMSAEFNAQYDVEVLAGAFNMDKADFIGRLRLIDDFTTFDNERFAVIRANSDMIEEVTAEELELMKGVQAVLIDEEWFQIYDNNLKFTEKYVASGMYWNYFLNSWKTVAHSPFANAVVFVSDSVTPPSEVTVEVQGKSIGENGTVLTLVADNDEPTFNGGNVTFVQTQDATEKGIAIHPYGAVIFPVGQTSTNLELTVNGVTLKATTALTTASTVGTTLTFNENGQ